MSSSTYSDIRYWLVRDKSDRNPIRDGDDACTGAGFYCGWACSFLPLRRYLTVVLALQIARRAGNYGITRPAREMLFTAVDRETRFKAKPVIDIAVYRGGDAASSIAFAGLTDGLGLGLGAVAAVGAVIAAVWAFVGRSPGAEITKPAANRSKGPT